MIPKCEHGVYSPDGIGRPSEYCSGCMVPTAPITAIAIFSQLLITGEDGSVVELELDSDKMDSVPCPLCSTPIVIEDEYDFECNNCGFNDL